MRCYLRSMAIPLSGYPSLAWPTVGPACDRYIPEVFLNRRSGFVKGHRPVNQRESGNGETENQEEIFAGIGCICPSLLFAPEATFRNGESRKMFGRA